MNDDGMPVCLKIPIRYAISVINKYRFHSVVGDALKSSDWQIEPTLLEWLVQHAPTAQIDYSRGQPVVNFDDERQAFEFKMRWF
jgi:hypothetical protein